MIFLDQYLLLSVGGETFLSELIDPRDAEGHILRFYVKM